MKLIRKIVRVSSPEEAFTTVNAMIEEFWRPKADKANKDRNKYADRLGNRRRVKYPGHNLKERVLLTVRQDALKIREAILAGRTKLALEEADWLVDRIDNSLAEGC